MAFQDKLTLCCKSRREKIHTSKRQIQDLDFTGLMKVCHQVESSLLASLSCIKSAKIRLDVTWYLQTCCKGTNLDHQLTSSVANPQQTCYHQAGASDANASWYQLDDCKATSLQQSEQTCCKLRVSLLYVSCINLSLSMTNVINRIWIKFSTNATSVCVTCLYNP